MDGLGMRRAAAVLLLALAAGAAGCAYEVARSVWVVAPERLARVRRVAVAPFRYENDWTGYFRDIYRSAGAEPPPVEKVDRVEATFLLEDALSRRGYAVVPWPGAPDDMGFDRPGDAGERGERFAPLRAAGADAVLVAEGMSRCESLEICRAEVRIRLFGAGGRLLWEGRAKGSSLVSQGDEMRAAVGNALAAFPRAAPRR